MISFIYHEILKKETAALKRRFRTIDKAFEMFERLCQVQFHSSDPKPVIKPGKLHSITQNDIASLWKVELVLPNSGLRSNQMPRMWFAVHGSTVIFLVIASHIDNYDDAEMQQLAWSRLEDII